MATQKPRTGGEIDAYCTKCKLDLGHRIIAMVGDEIKKVECRTCGSHHLYRRPKSQREERARILEAKPTLGSASTSGGTAKTAAPRTNSERVRAAEKAEREQLTAWEKAIAGQPASAFKPFRITLTLAEGELVRHSKFGDGVVAKVIDKGKVEILFQDGPRTMAHGQQPT